MKARRWFRIHSFTGIITGLLLFIVCWSGTFAVVSNEIDWLVTPEMRVAVQERQASWAAIEAAVRTAYPDATIKTIAAPRYPRFAAIARIAFSGDTNTHVFVDPYDAKVIGATSGFTVQRFFRDFHRRLFFPGYWGHYLVCFFSLTLFVSLLAALIFYKRWWRRFFVLKIEPRWTLWSNLHRFVGLWSIWFILIMALTGTWYLFEEARGHIGDGIVVYAGTTNSAMHKISRPISDTSIPRLELDELVSRAVEARPDIHVRNIVFRVHGEGKGNVLYLDGQADEFLVRDRANHVQLDMRSGEILYSQRASDLPPYWRWSDTADPLHFGDFAGLVSKLAWFVFGLLLSGLILTGTWLHARRLAREAKGQVTRTRWPGTLASAVTSLSVLALSVPFCFQEAISDYGPVVDGVKQVPSLAPGVVAVIVSWILITVIIVTTWGALLWRPGIAIYEVAGAQRAACCAVSRDN